MALTDDAYDDHVRRLRSALRAAPGHLYSTPPYSPERRAAHADILDDAWAELGGDDVPKARQGLILAGLPGSLKTTARTHGSVDGIGPIRDHFLPIDADYFKGKLIDAGLAPTLPGFAPMEAAPLFHKESNDLAKALAARAYAQGTNVAWDATLRHSHSGDSRLGEFARHGYTGHGLYTHADPAEALARVTKRHRDDLESYLEGTHRHGGRYVPPEILRDSIHGDRIANREHYDEIAPYLATSQILDTTGGRLRRMAAVTQDLVDRLHDEFHDWWADKERPKVWDLTRGPIGEWSNIESFLRERYPAAYRGADYGQEQVAPALDGQTVCPTCRGEGDKPDEHCVSCEGDGKVSVIGYETGADAVSKYGYDPAEIAASFVLLHNKSHHLRGDLSEIDQARLTDIAQKRFQMQRQYEQRNRTALRKTAADLAKEHPDWNHDHWEDLDWSPRHVTAHRTAMPDDDDDYDELYHFTDDPHFAGPRPDHEPATISEFAEPGIYLTNDPHNSSVSGGGRPYMATFRVPSWYQDHPGFEPDHYGNSSDYFVRPEWFHELKLTGVSPSPVHPHTAHRTAGISDQPDGVTGDYTLAEFLQWCAHNRRPPTPDYLAQYAAVSGMDAEDYLNLYLFLAQGG